MADYLRDYVRNLSLPEEDSAAKDFYLRNAGSAGGSNIPEEETPAPEPSKSLRLWSGTYVPEGETPPEGLRQTGRFSATNVAPESQLKGDVNYGLYESPTSAATPMEETLNDKISRFKEIAIGKIGYDPDKINPDKQAYEDFTKDLPGLFRHVFQGNAVWNNLTPEQQTHWDNIKKQYMTQKVKEYTTTKKDGDDMLKTMMTLFGQEMGRSERGTKIGTPGSYVLDREGNVIKQLPEKAEKPARITGNVGINPETGGEEYINTDGTFSGIKPGAKPSSKKGGIVNPLLGTGELKIGGTYQGKTITDVYRVNNKPTKLKFTDGTETDVK